MPYLIFAVLQNATSDFVAWQVTTELALALLGYQRDMVL